MYKKIIEKLELEPLHSEGGFYKEIYRSKDSFHCNLNGINENRSHSTAIYYLITTESFSTLHRIKQDEIFHFYAGNLVEMVQITSSGEAKFFEMGNNVLDGQTPQVVVPAGIWQGLKLKEETKEGWALLGTTVSPGFEFSDFETGKRNDLILEYPQIKEHIIKYTSNNL